MPESCKEKILSNDYADWIVDFELTDELLDRDTENLDYCYRQVDRILGLVFIYYVHPFVQTQLNKINANILKF